MHLAEISKEATVILKILQKEGVDYELEYRFRDPLVSRYRFDFAIFDENKQIKCLLEYDSVLHFKETGLHHGRVAFTKAQERDRVKNQFCLRNKIPLYRIPYWALKDIHTFADCLNPKFLVTSKWHNDRINPYLRRKDNV